MYPMDPIVLTACVAIGVFAGRFAAIEASAWLQRCRRAADERRALERGRASWKHREEFWRELAEAERTGQVVP